MEIIMGKWNDQWVDHGQWASNISNMLWDLVVKHHSHGT